MCSHACSTLTDHNNGMRVTAGMRTERSMGHGFAPGYHHPAITTPAAALQRLLVPANLNPGEIPPMAHKHTMSTLRATANQVKRNRYLSGSPTWLTASLSQDVLHTNTGC